MSGDVKRSLAAMEEGMKDLNEEQAGRVMVRLKDFLAGAVFAEARAADREREKVGA